MYVNTFDACTNEQYVRSRTRRIVVALNRIQPRDAWGNPDAVVHSPCHLEFHIEAAWCTFCQVHIPVEDRNETGECYGCRCQSQFEADLQANDEARYGTPPCIMCGREGDPVIGYCSAECAFAAAGCGEPVPSRRYVGPSHHICRVYDVVPMCDGWCRQPCMYCEYAATLPEPQGWEWFKRYAHVECWCTEGQQCGSCMEYFSVDPEEQWLAANCTPVSDEQEQASADRLQAWLDTRPRSIVLPVRRHTCKLYRICDNGHPFSQCTSDCDDLPF